MKIISRAATEFFTANPSPEGLRGYSLEQELRKAVKAAVKPLAKKLAHYRSETARLQANIDRWSPEAHERKMEEITRAAHSGDASAEAAIESGAIASKQSYAEMHGRFCRELEQFQRDSRNLFAEVLPLIEPPMTKAVDVGQDILDSILEGVGVPPFQLTGWRNHISYVLLQLQHASRNESCDLQWFWVAVE